MIYDFHTHTTLSDGQLSPLELVRRALVNGYHAMAITDHAALGSLDRFAYELGRDCELARQRWGITAFPGVELTHVPAEAINEAARAAKAAGAWIVVVHGETVTEPVEPGTNLAAVSSPHVDVLAHPGLITEEVAALAARNGVFLEISARRGHSAANGHVVKVARRAGAQLIVDSDHHDLDLLTTERARAVALGAGLEEADLDEVLRKNPQALLERILARRAATL